MRFLLSLFLLFGGFAHAAETGDTPVFAVNMELAGSVISSGAYIVLTSSSPQCSKVAVFNSSARTLFLALGPASGEQRFKYDIPPASGSVQIIKMGIKEGSRVTVRAVGSDASTGWFVFNCLQ